MRGGSAPLPESGIYRTILFLLVADVVAGVLIALAGELLWQDPAIRLFGSVLALVGAALYAFFRWLGARQTRRLDGQ